MINFLENIFENSKPKILVNPKRIFPIKNKLKKKNYIIKEIDGMVCFQIYITL